MSHKIFLLVAGVGVLTVIAIAGIVALVLLFNVSDNGDVIYEDPVVQTNLGKIRGSIFYTRHDKKFYGFRGLRYAQPPIDDLRFQVNILF